MSSEFKDYYEVLQVHPKAEDEVIEAAYKRLARKYHPDSNQSSDATRIMQNINEAYEHLKNPIKRNIFDREREVYIQSKAARFKTTGGFQQEHVQDQNSGVENQQTDQQQQARSRPSQQHRSRVRNKKTETHIEQLFREAWKQHVPHILLEQEYEVNVHGRKRRIDFAHLGTKVAIELDSFEHHAKNYSDWIDTHERRQELEAQGWKVYAIAGGQVTRDALECVHKVQRFIEDRMREQGRDTANSSTRDAWETSTSFHSRYKSQHTSSTHSPFSTFDQNGFSLGNQPAFVKQVVWLVSHISGGMAACIVGVLIFGLIVPIGEIHSVPLFGFSTDWLLFMFPILLLSIVIVAIKMSFRISNHKRRGSLWPCIWCMSGPIALINQWC